MLNNQEEQEFQEVNAAKYMYDNGEDKHFVVSAEIYPFDIFCFFGSKAEAYKTLNIYESLGIISSAENKQSYEFIKDSENFFAMSPDGFSLLYVENVPNSINNLAILNHEIWHIADEILRSVGIKSSRETCEVYAYFIQFLSERIYEKLGLCVAIMQESNDESFDESLDISYDEAETEEIKFQLTILKFQITKPNKTVEEHFKLKYAQGFLIGAKILEVAEDNSITFKKLNWEQFYYDMDGMRIAVDTNASDLVPQNDELCAVIEDLQISNHNPTIFDLKEGMNILVCGKLETKIVKIVDDKIYFMNENIEEFETIDAIKILQ